MGLHDAVLEIDPSVLGVWGSGKNWAVLSAGLRSEMYHHFVLHQTVDTGPLLHHTHQIHTGV